MSVVRWDAPGPYEVFFSDRLGGVSEGPYASLNLGLSTADAPAHVRANRDRLADETGIALACRGARNTSSHRKPPETAFSPGPIPP